jgi:hypothetical protein
MTSAAMTADGGARRDDQHHRRPVWTGLETATTVAAIVIAVGCAVLIPLVIRRA